MNAEPNPEPNEFPLLDGYWESLQRGESSDPGQWLSGQTDKPGALGALKVLAALDEARRLLDADTHHGGPDTGAPPGASPHDLLLPGTKLGECRLDGLLGWGGMGEVYLAEHEVLGRQVAVKVLPARLAADAEAVRRFRHSVQLLARLNPHPHIAAALHASEHDGRLYLVMEYVPGTDLKSYVRQTGPLSVDEACAYVRQTAEGLDYAHRQGIVHRDIKPANLMRTPEGNIKILDLGLARVTQGDAPAVADQTDPRALLGTVDYMAPEQARDARQADARSDLYSLGCTFYYLLTGRPPFEGETPVAKVLAHAYDEVVPLARVRPEVPPAVAAVVHRLLAKEPEQRYPSARALVEALDAATGRESPVTERGARPAATTATFAGKGKWLLGVAALVAVAVGVALYVKGRPSGEGGDAAQKAAVSEPEVALQDLEVLKGDPDEPDKIKWVYRSLVRDGKELPGDPLPPLGPGEGISLTGHLSQPTHWYVVWIDTNGQAQLEGSSAEEQEVRFYPGKDGKAHFAVPAKTDPKGVHLVLLAVGSLPKEEAQAQIEERLKGIGVPPPVIWSGSLRGPEAAAANVELPSDYLRKVAARLPAGLTPKYALFIRTVD